MNAAQPSPQYDALMLADAASAFSHDAATLHRLCAGSPWLGALMVRDPDFAAHAWTTAPLVVFHETLDALKSTARAQPPLPQMAQALRQAKARLALVIGLADFRKVWSTKIVCHHLTEFADAVLGTALDWLLRDAMRSGRLTGLDEANPGAGSGFVVLAMGKMGAFELNYSSDIDLIILYDPLVAPLVSGTEPSTFFVGLTRRLVALLQDPDDTGYCLRVDLRLRPDPRATQVAISIESAAHYYETQGQNWERAAMIKARPAAGDRALGFDFLKRLQPYIWRKYLDFAAISDIQSLKRQIHSVKGHGQIAVLGHNIKLGRGGIREIEFFVQTQQLIAGGRTPVLRGQRTDDMLGALAHAGWITPETAQELVEAYWFLRLVENRLQMVDDAQTHVLPASEEIFAGFASFCDFPSAEAFSTTLRATFATVSSHYSQLFETAENLGTGEGSLVFTGGEDDPDTLATLARMGYRRTSDISGIIRSWHFGRYPAMRSARSRELLTELMPVLLKAFAATSEADETFLAFDRFLGGLPGGVQLFSMLKANPDLLDLLARILGSAPRLSAQLAHRPRILDAVLEPGFFGPLPDKDSLARIFQILVPQDLALDELIERARIAGREQQFRIGVRILSDTLGAEAAGAAWSNLAEIVIATLLAGVQKDMEAHHGRIEGSRVAIIAMGKLGGREMTATSDLDLIVVYDGEDTPSDGPRSLGLNQYYARLTQRLVAALSSPTSEGVLYEVDLRLRPSGTKGPVAANLASFCSYHADSAWVWEQLALTRARVVAGDEALSRTLTGEIAARLSSPRNMEKVRTDVLAMRALMLKELANDDPWDLKQPRGGLIDIEFIAQFLQIINASSQPAVLHGNSVASLKALGAAGVLSPDAMRTLVEAAELFQRLSQILRLSVEPGASAASAPAGLARNLARAASSADINGALALVAETKAQIAALFNQIIGPV